MQMKLFEEEPPITETKKPDRKYLGWPCDIAQELPIDERPKHIKNCDECKKLERKLDGKLGVEKHIWS